MILTDIKSGDVVTIYVPFKWNKLHTYMSAIVRFLINYQYYMRWMIGRKDLEKCPINHVGILCYDRQGVLWFYEANEHGFVKVLAEDRFAPLEKHHVYVQRFGSIDRDPFPLLESLVGTWYNWLGLIIAQPIRQLTFNMINLEAVKRQSFWMAYCSQIVAYAIYILSGKKDCQDWPSLDPQDIFFNASGKVIIQ